MSTLAEKIDHLFKQFTRPDGREYTYQDVELGTGKAITDTYVWKLRSGQATNPSYRVLKALSDFFEVPVSYFFGEEVAPDYLQQMQLASQLHKAGVANIALRASGLDERGRQAILDMIEYVRKAQGLESTLPDEESKDA